eukprot:1341164-Amorphochlora_amoeboformis.AAC.2
MRVRKTAESRDREIEERGGEGIVNPRELEDPKDLVPTSETVNNTLKTKLIVSEGYVISQNHFQVAFNDPLLTHPFRRFVERGGSHIREKTYDEEMDEIKEKKHDDTKETENTGMLACNLYYNV